MNLRTVLLNLALSTLSIQQAVAIEAPTAGDVYFDCLIGQAGADKPHGDLCVFAIWGFTEGYVAGIAQGSSSALIYDEKALGTTEGIKDLRERLDRIRRHALCLSEGAVLTGNFMRYMESHPAKRTDLFRDVMRDMLDDTFKCN